MNYISTYLQHQRRLLEESVTRFLTEGKHWPQDYFVSASNKLKSRFPGIPDEDIKKAIVKVQKDIESIPAAHGGPSLTSLPQKLVKSFRLLMKFISLLIVHCRRSSKVCLF